MAVNEILRRGDIAPVIIEVAEDKSADFIVLGISHGEIVTEWMNAKVMEKRDIPVLLIPNPDKPERIATKTPRHKQ